MEQTAVEWLIENSHIIPKTRLNKRELIQQANEMFEKQIIEAWDKGDCCIDLPDGGWEQKYKSGEEYYNEIFKSE